MTLYYTSLITDTDTDTTDTDTFTRQLGKPSDFGQPTLVEPHRQFCQDLLLFCLEAWNLRFSFRKSMLEHDPEQVQYKHLIFRLFCLQVQFMPSPATPRFKIIKVGSPERPP